MLDKALKQAVAALDELSNKPATSPVTRECGRVTSLHNGIAKVTGLPEVALNELLVFAGGALGIAIDLDESSIGAMLLTEATAVIAGSVVYRLGRSVETLVGEALLGRVVDATGRCLDDGPTLTGCERSPIENPAPEIMQRAPVNRSLTTGITAVDALIPIGRGQRELIIGDRQTGKTAVAIDTILNQIGNNMVCIYCAIGQRKSAVATVIGTLRAYNALDHCIVVVAGDDDPPGLRFITPYAATSMAEHFMRQGRDTLIVYDDLTRHARAYRELSLLLRHPPGREAFPGDIFYVHARLLERATQLNAANGGGSLTALPIIETQAQDISAYIPTNLISITDGQIYLSPELFNKGQLPAIDIGRSVSRVGGKTQYPTLRKVAAELRLSYSQFEELESFARFSSRLDPATELIVERGKRARMLLRQAEQHPLSVSDQVACLLALNTGLLDAVALDRLGSIRDQLQRSMARELQTLCTRIDEGNRINPQEWQALEKHLRQQLMPASGN